MPNCHLHKLLGCLCRRLFYLLADIVIDDTRLQHIEHLHLIISFEEFEETAFKLIHLVQRHILQQTVRAAIKNGNLLLYRHRTVLGLHQQTGIFWPLSMVSAVTGSISPLNLVNASSSRYCAWSIFNVPATFFIALIWGVTAYTAHGDTYVDSRTVALVKEVGVEEYLPVGNGDYVCRDVSRHVARLRFDNGKRRQ